MADNVGAVSVSVEPDLSNFGQLLSAALAPALAAGVDAVSAATAEMASTGETNVENLASAIESSLGDATAAVADDLTTVSDAAASVFSDVSGEAEGTAASIEGSIGPAVETAAAEVAAGSEEMVTSLGTVGGATDDVVDGAERAGDALGRFGSEGGQSVLSLGDLIKGVAIGDLISEGIQAGVDAALLSLSSFVGYLPELGAEFDSAFDSIRISTGEAAEGVAGLDDVLRNIASDTPADFASISDALAGLNIRLGLTGQPLEDLATQFLRLSDLTDSSVSGNVKAVTGLFNNFTIAAEDQGEKLDFLFRVYQRTTTPVDELASVMSKVGPLARQAGLDFEQTAGFVGLLGKSGLGGQMAIQAFTKVLTQAQKTGSSVEETFNDLFTGIQDGSIKAGDETNIFTGRAASMFDLIKSGNLDYKTFAASVAEGSDSILQAAADTDDWQQSLEVITNQLKLQLEPVANFVFGRISDVVATVGPVIADVAATISSTLGDAWDVVVEKGEPVVEFIDRFKGPLLIGLAAAITSVVVPAVVALTAALIPLAVAAWGVVSPILAVAAPFIAVGLAISAVTTAVVIAYQSWEPFRNVVDSIAAGIVDILLPAFEAVSDFVTGTVQPWIENLVTQLGNLWDVFQSGDDVIQGTAEILDNIFGNTGALVDPLRDLGETLAQVWGFLTDTFDEVKTSVLEGLLPALSGLWEALGPLVDGLRGLLQPILEWMIDHWQIFAAILAVAISPIGALVAGLGFLYVKFQVVRDIVSSVIEHLEPFVKLVIDFVSGSLQTFIHLLTSVVEVLTGLITLDFGKVVEGLTGIGGAILEGLGNIGSTVVAALSGLGSILADVLRTAITFVVSKGPEILGFLWEWIESWPGWIFDRLLGLGQLLLDLWIMQIKFVVEHGPEILAALWGWISQIPGMVGGFLAGLGQVLVDIWTAAFDFVVSSSITVLEQLLGWILTIPVLIFQALVVLGPALWDAFVAGFQWVVDNGPGILAALMGWVVGLPATIIGWLGNLGALLWQWWVDAVWWVIDNGPGILQALMDWVVGLPGTIMGWLGDLGGLLVDWFTQGFALVVEKGPDIIAGVLTWFGTLPGKIFDAIRTGLSTVGGFVGDIASDIWNAIKGFLNEHVVNPIRDFKISILGSDYTPFGSLPEFERGGIFDTPTAGIFGEAGAEALIPLTNESRAAQVATDAGIPGILARQGGMMTAPQILQFYLTLEVDADTTAAKVDEIVQTAGAAIARTIPSAVSQG